MPSLFSGELEVARTTVAKGVSGAISVTTQVAIAAGVITISGAVPDVVKPAAQPLRYITAVLPAALPVEVRIPPTPVEKAPAREVAVAEPAPERPALVAVREFENHALPTPTAAEVRPIEFAALPAPVPQPPKPVVGAFANTASMPRTPEQVGRVESAGFNAQVAQANQSKPGTAAIGTFETAAMAANVPTQQSRMIREGGFGSSSNAERPKTHHLGELKPASFGDARIVEATRRTESAAAARSVIPVEVLSKPAPNYTDEARRLKIEGEVVLEVEFLAGGSVRVVKVVRGLGHGLDESATAAAQGIQFKPAIAEGRPVDFRATVQIVFRLA